jgi:nitrite reductase/ring-hydroxylating ferredoxin subunit
MIVFIANKDLPVIGEYKYFDYPDLKNELLVWNDAGTYRIYSSFCPHFGGPLAIKDGQLHCYFHDYRFDIENGTCLNREFGAKCQKMDFFVETDGLSVEIS